MAAGLPYDAEIEYLESTGTQWIDTGVSMSRDLYFSLSIEPTYSTGDRKYMGVYNSSYGVCQLNGYWRLMATGWYLSNIPVSADTFTLIERKTDGWYIEGTNVRSLWTEGPSSNNLVVFAFKEENDTVNPTTSLCKIARLKLYTGTTLVRDYIPVRVGQVGYLYDRVSRRLFGNMGTGFFVLGPDVARPVMCLHTYPQVYTASDYVQDGLIAMWDGIENAGWGVHDASATTWKDLVGDRQFTLGGACEWGSDHLKTKNSLTQWTGAFFDSPSYFTIEMIFTTDFVSCGEYASPLCTRDDTFSIFSRNGLVWEFKFNAAGGSRPQRGPRNGVPIFAIFKQGYFGLGYTSSPSQAILAATTLTGYNDNAEWDLGGNGFGASRFLGINAKYYGLRVYNRALTESEIAANYAIDKARFGLGMGGSMIDWTDGYRYLSDGTTGASDGKSAMDTYVPIVGGHAYTVLCGAGGTANRYAHVYRSDRTRIESVNETKYSETFSFTANANAAWLRITANTDAKADVYVHDDTDDKYIVKNGRILP